MFETKTKNSQTLTHTQNYECLNLKSPGSKNNSVVLVEQWTHDQMVSGAASRPGTSSTIISFPGSAFCADFYFGICSTPMVPL